MKLSDLKTGMHVILRDGDEYIVLKDTCLCLFDHDTYGKNIIKKLNDGLYTSLNNYNEDFTNADEFKTLDIVEVYTCNYVSVILKSVKDTPDSFTRIFLEKPKKMTLEEIEKVLGYRVEIIE